MSVCVCIKQASLVTGGATGKRHGQLNLSALEGEPAVHDCAAIEFALRARDIGAGRVDAIAVETEFVGLILENALLHGVDRAFLMSDDAFIGSDVFATAYTLSLGIEQNGYDLIVCGERSTRDSTGLVPPEIACRLKLPFISGVCGIEEVGGGFVKVWHRTQTELRLVRVDCPCVISVSSEGFMLRRPSLEDKLKAGKKQIVTLGVKDLGGVLPDSFGFAGSKTRVMRHNIKSKAMKAAVTSTAQEAADLIWSVINRGV